MPTTESNISFRFVSRATRAIARFAYLAFTWDEVLSDVVPSFCDLRVVVSSPRGLSSPSTGKPPSSDPSAAATTVDYTFAVSSGTARNLGWGATLAGTHNADALRRSFEVSVGATRFNVSVYPTDQMYKAYISGLPLRILLGAGSQKSFVSPPTDLNILHSPKLFAA